MTSRDYIEFDLFDEKIKLFQRSTFEVQALDIYILNNYGYDAQLDPFDYAYVNSIILSNSLMPNIDELKKLDIPWYRLIKRMKINKKISLYKKLFNPKSLQKTFSPPKLSELKEIIIFDVEKTDRNSVKKKVEIQ